MPWAGPGDCSERRGGAIPLEFPSNHCSTSPEREVSLAKPSPAALLSIVHNILRARRYVVVPLLAPSASSDVLFAVACIVTGCTLFIMGAVKVSLGRWSWMVTVDTERRQGRGLLISTHLRVSVTVKGEQCGNDD